MLVREEGGADDGGGLLDLVLVVRCGAIEKMVLPGLLRRRFCLPFCGECFRSLNSVSRRGKTREGIGEECGMLTWFGTDADVLGLGADIESAIYKELISKNPDG